MFLSRRFLFALPLVLAQFGCTPIGCSGEDPEQDKPSNEQFTGAVEQALPLPTPGASLIYGTWKGDMTGGQYNMLVLMTNKHYHATKSVTCIKAPCDAAVADGSYGLYTRESRNYIVFGDASAPNAERYEYAISDNSIRLRPLVPGSEWYSLSRSGTAWCATQRECTVQNLPPGVCAGAYTCENSACSWSCAGGGEPSAVEPQGATK